MPRGIHSSRYPRLPRVVVIFILMSSQIELLEMRVEMMLVQKGRQADAKKGTMYAEARAWARLFERRYIDRTLIGILMMFFQRQYSPRAFWRPVR